MTRPQKLGPQRVHFVTDSAASRNEVFAFFADHERFGTLFATSFAAKPGALIKRTRTATEGNDPNGIGSVRTAKLGPFTLLEEVIVHFEPGQCIEYTATKGPIRNHLGRIEFSDIADGGTHIDYRIWFDAALPGLGKLIAMQLGNALSSGWKRSERQLATA